MFNEFKCSHCIPDDPVTPDPSSLSCRINEIVYIVLYIRSEWTSLQLALRSQNLYIKKSHNNYYTFVDDHFWLDGLRSAEVRGQTVVFPGPLGQTLRLVYSNRRGAEQTTAHVTRHRLILFRFVHGRFNCQFRYLRT